MVTKETKDILLGKYGATVKPFNPEVQKKCIGDEKPITCRPAPGADGAFTENINAAGGAGAAEFAQKAIEIYCK